MPVIQGDCREVMARMEENSIDSIVTDPPYGLEFMGKEWDKLSSPQNGGARFTEDGMGKGFKALPSFKGSPNPLCLNCGGSKRGKDRVGFKRCQCDNPLFPNVAKEQNEGMQHWHYLWAIEAFRVAKPGAHMLVFGGTRTHHRLMVAIEDAGWEIRDTCGWLYGSGFPKSLNISKSLDKAAGAEREVVGRDMNAYRPNAVKAHQEGQVAALGLKGEGSGLITAPATDAAKEWDGWGTALKPAWEPIIVCRKPLDGTVAQNVLKWGVGGINIDGCRVETNDNTGRPQGSDIRGGSFVGSNKKSTLVTESHQMGRFPANIIHDGSEEVLEIFPITKSGKPGTMRKCVNESAAYGAESREPGTPMTGFGDEGSAARFFYCAKASSSERNFGCELLDSKMPMFASDTRLHNNGDGSPRSTEPSIKNVHPTVKPLSLMRYLCRLVTPPGGIVLDPFAGSGSTGCAAVLEGFTPFLIEMEPEYVEIAKARLKYWSDHKC